MKRKNVVISLIFPVLTLIANLWTLLFGFPAKTVFIMLFAAFIFGGIPTMMTLCGVDTSEYVIEKFIFVIVHTILWAAVGFLLYRQFISEYGLEMHIRQPSLLFPTQTRFFKC